MWLNTLTDMFIRLKIAERSETDRHQLLPVFISRGTRGNDVPIVSVQERITDGIANHFPGKMH